MSLKYLCISDDTVKEVPIRSIKEQRMLISEFAGKTVLKAESNYIVQNRKPTKLVRILFERISFDEDGVYDIPYTYDSPEVHVKLEYALAGMFPSSLPVPIPPTIPDKREIDVIKQYLNQKYPLLLSDFPQKIEYSINNNKELHRKKTNEEVSFSRLIR